MFNLKTLKIISGLRSTPNKAGKYVTLRPGYTKIWEPALNAVKRPNHTYDDQVELIHDLNIENKTFTEVSESIEDVIFNSLTTAKSLYKNVVMQEVKAYRDNVLELVDAWSKSVPESDVVISYLDVPEVLLTNPDLFNLTTAINEKPVKIETSYIPDVLGLDLYATVTDDIAPSDAELKLWLAAVGSETFNAYVDNIFGGTELPAKLGRIDYNIEGKLTKSMIAVIVAKALMAKVPDNISISLNEYESKLNVVIKAYSVQLVGVMKSLNQYKATNTLILTEDKQNKTALVFQPVLDEWLENEGSFEILMGKILSNDAQTTTPGIAKNMLKYSDKWKQYNDITLLKKNSKKNMVIRNILKTMFSKGLNNPSENEVQFRNGNPNVNAQSLQRTAESAIDKLSDLELSNLSTTCMTLVSKIRFGHTSAYEFLSSMEATMKIDKDADIDKAILAAMLNEVSRFISDSMQEVRG